MSLGVSSLAYSLMSFLLLAQSEEEDGRPRKVDWPVQTVYATQDFDTKDIAQFVIAGEFPNRCYSLGSTWSKVYADHQLILFQYDVYKKDGECPDAKTPFYKVIDVGVLPEGEFKIANVKKMDKYLARLHIVRR